MKKQIDVLIADDHQIFREGIASLLNGQKEINVVAESANGEEILESLNNTKIDVVLMDINMPKMNGIECAAIIKNKYPKVNILVFSSHDKDQYIVKMLQMGVAGYILKTCGINELTSAIKTVSMGCSYFCKEVTNKIVEQFSNKGKLKKSGKEEITDREMEVLKLVSKGLRNNEIGTKLFISPRTVDTHRRNLMQKLGLHSAIELANYAMQNNLLD